MKLIKFEVNKERKYINEPLIQLDIQQIPALYFIFNKEKELVYIGQTNRLRGRLCQHTSQISQRSPLGLDSSIGSNIPLGESIYFSFVIEQDECRRKAYESMLIMIFKPKYNHNF